MKRALFASMCLSVAFACTPAEPGGEGQDTSGESEDSTTEPTTTTDTMTTTMTGDGDGDSVPEVIATIDGMITDPDGAALPTPGVQFCGPVDADTGEVELCIPITAEADGSFHIDATIAGIWNLKVVHGDTDGGRKFAGQAFQVTISEGNNLEFNDPAIVVPEVTAVTMLPESGATVVDVDGGVSITIDPASAQAPDFTAPSELGGVVIDPLFWPYTEVEGEAIVAAWGFTPFGVKAKDGTFDVELKSALGLAPDAAVNLYEIEKDNGALHLVGTGLVSVDATSIAVTAAGEGLHELTWLVVTTAG